MSTGWNKGLLGIISRLNIVPKVLVEVGIGNHLKEIEKWMKDNEYIKICIFSADTVYIRKR